MGDQSCSGTTNGREQVAVAVALACALVSLLLGWLWLAVAAFVVGLAAVVVQDRREKRDRRAAIERLKSELPSMSEPERQAALRRFRERFPARTVRKELDRYVAGLRNG